MNNAMTINTGINETDRTEIAAGLSRLLVNGHESVVRSLLEA